MDRQLKHIVCGHEGTLSWSSSTYVAVEGARNVRLVVQRTGGGVGAVSVHYTLHHITTEEGDLSDTAPYTLSTLLQFGAGVTELSFLLTVHDDYSFEGGEIAVVELTRPKGGATLGPQRRATVTIVDDDSNHASAQYSRIMGNRQSIAGNPSQLILIAYSGKGVQMHIGGETFLLEHEPFFFQMLL